MPLQSGSSASVEEELDTAAGCAAVDRERDARFRRAGRRSSARARREEAERQADLGQRERVRLLAELQVHDEDLGEEERDREHPPLEMRAGHEPRRAPRRTATVQTPAHGEGDAGVEEPDARGAGDGAAESAQDGHRLVIGTFPKTQERGRPTCAGPRSSVRINPSSLRAIRRPTNSNRSSSSRSRSCRSTSCPTSWNRSRSCRTRCDPLQLEPLQELPLHELPDQLEPLHEFRTRSCPTSRPFQVPPDQLRRQPRGRPSRRVEREPEDVCSPGA